MKALSLAEIQNISSQIQHLIVGSQLQEVLVNDRGLALGLHKGTQYWLVLDLVPNAPMMLLFKNQCPFRKGAKAKPVSLFLNSHGKNLYFHSVRVVEEYGRVVRMSFKNSQIECEIEVRLIPKQANIIVRADGKQIAWEKPLPLTAAPPVLDAGGPLRTVDQIQAEWMSERNSPQKSTLDPQVQWEKQKAKDLEKKKKALTEIQQQIESEEHLRWSEAGQFLKENSSLEVPELMRKYIKANETLSWNIENSFSKAKQIAAKKIGARARYEKLLLEISELEKAQYKARAKKESLGDLMRKAEAKGRKLVLDSGALAYCGKSARDNLALLRQAKSWDYWLHLRDFPGAHAIIHRQREQVISDSEVEQVARWVAQESLSEKSLLGMPRFAVVIVECRFVRPIKGDKLGRVSYHSERTISFTSRHA